MAGNIRISGKSKINNLLNAGDQHIDTQNNYFGAG